MLGRDGPNACRGIAALRGDPQCNQCNRSVDQIQGTHVLYLPVAGDPFAALCSLYFVPSVAPSRYNHPEHSEHLSYDPTDEQTRSKQ